MDFCFPQLKEHTDAHFPLFKKKYSSNTLSNHPSAAARVFNEEFKLIWRQLFNFILLPNKTF